MTDDLASMRHTVDTLTSDALDALYTSLEAAEAALDRVRSLRDDLRGTTGARYIADALDTILNGEQPHATPGPCPACRRADQAGLAPTEQHRDCAKEQHR
jgi:hypothetical protein